MGATNMQNNPYVPWPSKILDVIKHTQKEYTFRMEYVGEVKPGQFFEVSIPKYGEAPISVSGIGPNFVDLTIRKVGRVTNEVFEKYKGQSLLLRASNAIVLEAAGDRGYEAVDILFPVAVGGIVEFALDRGEAVFVAKLGYKVDSGVAGIPAVGVGPILEGLNLLILFKLDRIMGEVGDGETLEICSLFPLGTRCITVGLQKRLQRLFGHVFPQAPVRAFTCCAGTGIRACSISASSRSVSLRVARPTTRCSYGQNRA